MFFPQFLVYPLDFQRLLLYPLEFSILNRRVTFFFWKSPDRTVVSETLLFEVSLHLTLYSNRTYKVCRVATLSKRILWWELDKPLMRTDSHLSQKIFGIKHAS